MTTTDHQEQQTMSVLTDPRTATGEAIPTWPHIVATVGADAPDQVSIDGVVHQVHAGDAEGARTAIIARVRACAKDLGRTVRMDTIGPEGGGQVLISPDGAIDDAGPDAPATTTHPHHHTADQDSAEQPTDTDTDTDTDTGAGQGEDEPHAHRAHRAPGARSDATAPASPAANPWPTRGADQDRIAPAPARETPDDRESPEGRASAAPTLADLLSARTTPRLTPAQRGWRAGLRTITGGVISPAPGRAELAQREAAATIARPLDGPKTVVVVNPKGGAHKTTAALLLAANLGRERGGYTLAWDNNETRGTMGWRAAQGPHTRTAINLLANLERFESRGARVGDLDAYVRAQAWGHFDVLASDEDANSADLVDGPAFEALHATLSRFYRVMVVDTGNNMRAPNWAAALAAADQLVIVTTIREDTSQSAAWLADALAATGHADLVAGAVTVLTAPARNSDAALATRLHQHFSHLTRTVLSVPHDPALIAGGPIDYAALTSASRTAWLRVTAAVTDGL